MTGTALTEAEEFHTIYKLDVVIIPSHKEMIRKDFSDQIYKDEKSKFRAVAREIGELHKEGRPVLVGTVSIEKSEHLSDLLKRNGIPHQILNAKQHEKEADIIARAGELGAVTVATNMAGRGVDIVLGGKEPTNGDKLEWRKWQENHNQVVELGGLHVTGTERHEARRIDNQLRGRAGRQGDPGSSRFYVSVEDDIMRRFGSDKIKGLMEWAGMDENTPIENRLVTRSIGEAQKRVEGYHFDIRKHLVEYDDVINRQREIIYDERRKTLSGADLKSNILSMVREELQGVVAAHLADAHEPDLDGLIAEVSTILPPPAEINAQALSQMKSEQIEERLTKHTAALYDEREKELGADNMRVLERLIMLRTIDNLWIEHLTAIDYIRQGIGLQAMAQRDPLVAYKRESHHMFEDLMSAIQHDVVHTIYHSGITRKEAPQSVASPMAELAAVGTGSDRRQPAKSTGKKMGRNDPCHCGSGKKFKKCCGK
jgi:preprotein translocase subunit SecA